MGAAAANCAPECQCCHEDDDTKVCEVTVIQEFMSDSRPAARLKRGMTGRVIKFDDAGDALIDFDDLEESQFVFENNLDKLTGPGVAKGTHTRGLVASPDYLDEGVADLQRWDAQLPLLGDRNGLTQFPFMGSDGRAVLAPPKASPRKPGFPTPKTAPKPPGSCSVPAAFAKQQGPCSVQVRSGPQPPSCQGSPRRSLGQSWPAVEKPEPSSVQVHSSPQPPTCQGSPQRNLGQSWPAVEKPEPRRATFVEAVPPTACAPRAFAARPDVTLPQQSPKQVHTRPASSSPAPQGRPTRTNGPSPVPRMLASGSRWPADAALQSTSPGGVSVSVGEAPLVVSPSGQDRQAYVPAPSPPPLEPDLFVDAAMGNENYAGYGLYSPASTIDILPVGNGYLQGPTRYDIFTPGFTGVSSDTPTPLLTSDGGTGSSGNRGGCAHERVTANVGRGRGKRGDITD